MFEKQTFGLLGSLFSRIFKMQSKYQYVVLYSSKPQSQKIGTNSKNFEDQGECLTNKAKRVEDKCIGHNGIGISISYFYLRQILAKIH